MVQSARGLSCIGGFFSCGFPVTQVLQSTPAELGEGAQEEDPSVTEGCGRKTYTGECRVLAMGVGGGLLIGKVGLESWDTHLANHQNHLGRLKNIPQWLLLILRSNLVIYLAHPLGKSVDKGRSGSLGTSKV